MKDQVSPLKEHHPDMLTWREQEVLFLLADRLTNQEIANHLHLAESTVKDYVGNILAKLYVKNRREAVEKAKILGLLDKERKADPVPKSNLPIDKTPFVGRKEELEEIQNLFKETRLLTLIGPGGMGKTRLALKAANDMAKDFPAGCFFISLAPIGSIDFLVQTIAEGINYPIATDETPLKQLTRYLRSRQMLLVMDNFEHLLDGAEIVSGILQAAPQVKVLTTSREKLNLHSETILNVGGMDLPERLSKDSLVNFDAITLFVQSARKVRAGFDPTTDELTGIGLICQFLGGMPLAIELAAAWMQILSVEEILVELKKNLDILSTDLRDAPERHRSIRSIFDHSWTLMSPEEKKIFMGLSVFQEGFTKEAAAEVVGASLRQLTSFVNNSFLTLDPTTGRLESHELLRQFAQEKLEENQLEFQAAKLKHGEYFAEFMDQGWKDLRSNKQKDTLIQIEADIENVRSAWEFFLLQRNIPMLWKIVYALWYVYWIRWWNQPGKRLFEDAATLLEGVSGKDEKAFRYLTLSLQSYFMAWLGGAGQGYEIALECVTELEILNQDQPLIFALDSLCVNSYFNFHFLEQMDISYKLLEVAERIVDPWFMAFSLYAVGLSYVANSRFEEAKEMAERNLAIYEEIGDVIGITTPLIVLGHAAFGLGELEEARKYYLRCLEISFDNGFYYSVQTASKYMAKVTLMLGRFEEAEINLRQALIITSENGFLRDIINLIFEYARLFHAQGKEVKAVSLLSLVIQHPLSDKTRMIDGNIRDNAKIILAEIKKKIPSEDFETAVTQGQALNVDELCRSLTNSR